MKVCIRYDCLIYPSVAPSECHWFIVYAASYAPAFKHQVNKFKTRLDALCFLREHAQRTGDRVEVQWHVWDRMQWRAGRFLDSHAHDEFYSE